MTSSTAFIRVDGRRTRVRVDGDPANPPVLLLHGIGRSLEDWAPQFPRLSGSYRLISIDLPGSGFSERSTSRASLSVLANGALATLDAIGQHEPVHVIGVSLGGAVAQQLFTLAPDRVASLVLVTSAGFGKEVALPLRLLSTLSVGRFLASRTTPFSARLAERMLFVNPELVTEARIDHALAIARQPDTGEVTWETANALATLRGLRPEWQEALSNRIAAERKPTLVIWGDRDRILPARHLDEAQRRLPHASSHLFTGVGHMPQIECPDEFASVVMTFLDNVEPTSLPRKRRLCVEPAEL
ncbi:alpha/beta fold hydrolase [Nocardioides marmoriginsengisoli]|uniref:Alpha/beta fold hydrolase n=1 Tax=Nocardioides marmoriginsengisoli TaxID=661483 RepID=A0A3N0CGZ3_9ACTN|nr:alpha/beta fold hydrolase [Nocardioides marmoriginsengisoli]RNL62717.1 alpha/beta fold hydrolase [Nocardioides marmoriginsengisoli]